MAWEDHVSTQFIKKIESALMTEIGYPMGARFHIWGGKVTGSFTVDERLTPEEAIELTKDMMKIVDIPVSDLGYNPGDKDKGFEPTVSCTLNAGAVMMRYGGEQVKTAWESMKLKPVSEMRPLIEKGTRFLIETVNKGAAEGKDAYDIDLDSVHKQLASLGLTEANCVRFVVENPSSFKFGEGIKAHDPMTCANALANFFKKNEPFGDHYVADLLIDREYTEAWGISIDVPDLGDDR